ALPSPSDEPPPVAPMGTADSEASAVLPLEPPPASTTAADRAAMPDDHWPLPPGRDGSGDEDPDDLEPEVYERTADEARAEGWLPSHDDVTPAAGAGDTRTPPPSDGGYRPIRPLDAPLPPREPTRESAPGPSPQPAPETPRRPAPLVDEVVTVLPPTGVEDSLFGGQHRKVGHPGRRQDPADVPDDEGDEQR